MGAGTNNKIANLAFPDGVGRPHEEHCIFEMSHSFMVKVKVKLALYMPRGDPKAPENGGCQDFQTVGT